MSDPSQHEASEGNLDHGLRGVEALFIVAHETTPADHPAKGALDDPALWQDLEPSLLIGATDDLEDKVLVAAPIRRVRS